MICILTKNAHFPFSSLIHKTNNNTIPIFGYSSMSRWCLTLQSPLSIPWINHSQSSRLIQQNIRGILKKLKQSIQNWRFGRRLSRRRNKWRENIEFMNERRKYFWISIKDVLLIRFFIYLINLDIHFAQLKFRFSALRGMQFSYRRWGGADWAVSMSKWGKRRTRTASVIHLSI